MIISASYKTDLPAFYGDWFLNRLRAGYCQMVNPYNRRAIRVDLGREAVDGFVFWTKNVGPFFGALKEVRAAGYPFVVQYTITGYPKALEYSVVDADRSADYVRRLADEYGLKAAVWRYDPVLFSTLRPAAFHVETFGRLAARLAGAVDEVVISFAHPYQKTRRNLDRAAGEFDFVWDDPDDAAKRALAARLVELATPHGIRLTVCSQPHYRVPGAADARCIDAGRLGEVAGRPITAKVKGNRPGCACFESRDIGEYDTCPHGCVYCYAVTNAGAARRRFKAHDPDSEFLFPPSDTADRVL